MESIGAVLGLVWERGGEGGDMGGKGCQGKRERQCMLAVG